MKSVKVAKIFSRSYMEIHRDLYLKKLIDRKNNGLNYNTAIMNSKSLQ